MRRLLLFDIDGTLLHSKGVGRRLVEAALAGALGRPCPTEGVSFSGKTDRQIFRELLSREHLNGHDIEELIETVLDAYSTGMERDLSPEGIEVLSGARETIAALDEEGRHVLGLLTGNLEPMAYLKLRHGAISDSFRHGENRLLGAFGCDHEDRNALPPIAMERARVATGTAFSAEEIVIIGDTPLDIACARAHGCRVVAVATGRFDAESLAAHQPDVLLRSLDDLDSVRAAIEMP